MRSYVVCCMLMVHTSNEVDTKPIMNGPPTLPHNKTKTHQAVKVFESATTDAVGERAPALWLEYAKFCRERGKFANAQKVYLRAVEVLEPAQVCVCKGQGGEGVG